MFQLSTEETFPDGRSIFKEGNAGDWIYVVLSGAVKLTKSVDGKEVEVDVARPGDVFGELSFISRASRTASAWAVGDTTLGIIDRNFLDEEFNKLSGDFRIILKALAERLKKTTELAISASLQRKARRVQRVLSLTYKSGSGLKRAFTEDMSIGGMFIRTESPLTIGELFTLKLHLPGVADPLTIGCEVVWVRTRDEASPSSPSGMGVHFFQISEADQRRLKGELAKRLA